MFLKETRVRRGEQVYTYVQLVEGFREGGRVRMRVVANLGRKEQLKASGELDRLAAAFTRLDPPPEGTRLRCPGAVLRPLHQPEGAKLLLQGARVELRWTAERPY